MQHVEHLGRHADALAHRHRDKLSMAASIGWAAKGALYVCLGVLAVMAAIGEGGAIMGKQGVLHWIASQPFGRVLLALAGIGFACYALWRFVEAIVDPHRHPDKKTMIAKRVGSAASGVLHAGLSVAAFQMLAGNSPGNGRHTWLAKAMSMGTGGVVLVCALGVIAILVGLYQFKKAASLEFMDEVDRGRMSHREVSVLRAVGRAGYAARGVVLPVIGYFLIVAALARNPSAAKGTGGALGALAQAGWWVLAIVAVGLTAYGILQLFFAKYRRVRLS